MTATAARTTAPADLRRFRRRTAAVLMPVGPAAVAVIRFIIPGEPYGESIHAHPDAGRMVLWLGVIAAFTLLPGAFSAGHVLRRKAPRLTAWSMALLIPGYLGMTALGATDVLVVAAHGLGLSPAEIDRIAGAVMEQPTVMLMVLVFVIGHIAGTVLLGAAMIASRLTPVPIGVLMLVSQPLHLVAVIIVSPALDLVAWGLTAVAMAFLAAVLWRTPDDEFDLPPVSRRGQ